MVSDGHPYFFSETDAGERGISFEGIRISEISLSNFDISDPVSIPLLFQTGYLTITNYDSRSGLYDLDYPNKEVRQSLLDALLSAYRCVFPGDSAAITDNIYNALQDCDVERLITGLNSIIASIPYDHWEADRESIFHIIMHLTFKKVGVDIESEVHSAKGVVMR